MQISEDFNFFLIFCKSKDLLLLDLTSRTYDVKARDIMDTSMHSLERDVKYKNAKKVIEESDWQILPVVDGAQSI